MITGTKMAFSTLWIFYGGGVAILWIVKQNLGESGLSSICEESIMTFTGWDSVSRQVLVEGLQAIGITQVPPSERTSLFLTEPFVIL